VRASSWASCAETGCRVTSISSAVCGSAGYERCGGQARPCTSPSVGSVDRRDPLAGRAVGRSAPRRPTANTITRSRASGVRTLAQANATEAGRRSCREPCSTVATRRAMGRFVRVRARPFSRRRPIWSKRPTWRRSARGETSLSQGTGGDVRRFP
jgi:hypothetical protein